MYIFIAKQYHTFYIEYVCIKSDTTLDDECVRTKAHTYVRMCTFLQSTVSELKENCLIQNDFATYVRMYVGHWSNQHTHTYMYVCSLALTLLVCRWSVRLVSMCVCTYVHMYEHDEY